MLSGQRAFRGDSAADTITAILTKEPPDLSQTNKEHPSGSGSDRAALPGEEPGGAFRVGARRRLRPRGALGRLARRPGVTGGDRARPKRKRAGSRPALIAGGRRPRRGSLRRLSLRQEGRLRPAAQLPAAHLPPRRGLLGALRSRRPDASSTRPPGTASPSSSSRRARIVPSRGSSASSARIVLGDLQVRRDRSSRSTGTSRSPSSARERSRRSASRGGVAPREILRRTCNGPTGAPDGKRCRRRPRRQLRSQLEYPIGKVLYQTAGWISHPRISPRGDLVAFMEHPQRRDDGGTVAVVDRAGKKRTLTETLLLRVRAWPGRRTAPRVWITGTRVGGNRALHAVSLSGTGRGCSRASRRA